MGPMTRGPAPPLELSALVGPAPHHGVEAQAVTGRGESPMLGEDRRGNERVVTQGFAGVFEHDSQPRNEFVRVSGCTGI